MPEPLVVRDFALLDEPQVAVIMASTTAELRRVYRPRVFDSTSTPADSGARLVACQGDTVVGVVEYLAAGDAWHLRGLAVDPGSRRKGVARALVQRLAQLARRAGAVQLTLSTIKETGNVPVFLRLGFAITGESNAEQFETPIGEPVVRVNLEQRI